MNNVYLVDGLAEEPPEYVISVIKRLRQEIPTLESKMKLPFLVLQDGKSKAYYIECHLNAQTAMPLIDLEAALDPDEQEEFRLQRNPKLSHKAFIKMREDAIENRQFSDIIVEYDEHYRPDKPLKVLGGQHRSLAIQEALKKKKNRNHGYKIYFNLNVEQRNEIAQIANTNIAISPDLIDRMQETLRGPKLRMFCQKIGILDKGSDFADRKNSEGIVTVRQMRSFIVNFFEGRKHTGDDFDTTLFMPYVCKAGQVDLKYLEISKNDNIWNDPGLIETGKNFTKLHKKQREVVENNISLKGNSEYKNKAISLALISSWAFVAGCLQGKKDKLNKLFNLPDGAKKDDPLVAKLMSDSSHPTDDETYRGLGTRYSEKDKGRLTELFLLYTESKGTKITKDLIDAAIMTYEAKFSNLKKEIARKKANL
jgi:hypothetical protein